VHHTGATVLNASKQGLTLTQLRQLATSAQAWQEAGRWLRRRLIPPAGLGVRAIVLDAEGRVLLVRHTYLAGWYFPGGGVEPGETLIECLARELAEETHVAIDTPPVLHGIFLQQRRWRSHHVACFVVRGFHQTAPREPDWEIAETGFFDPTHLPRDTSRATRTRLSEVLEGLPPASIW
jgi:ADP-ribose pyrophosphatase YjhB (NUDIX family)